MKKNKKDTNKINICKIIKEIEIEREIDFDVWGECYFRENKSDLYHEKGTCMLCDWEKYSMSIKEDDLITFNFIEGWDWPEIWKTSKNRENLF